MFPLYPLSSLFFYSGRVGRMFSQPCQVCCSYWCQSINCFCWSIINQLLRNMVEEGHLILSSCSDIEPRLLTPTYGQYLDFSPGLFNNFFQLFCFFIRYRWFQSQYVTPLFTNIMGVRGRRWWRHVMRMGTPKKTTQSVLR